MNSLSNYLVEQILLEDKSPIKDVVVVYVGRFQPMHKGHYAVYDHLTKKFGKKNVFVGTSDKVEKGRSPFSFREKQEIMYTMFGIPKNRIVNVKNPYAPTEVLKKYNEKTTAFVTVVGEKDKSRLGGKYFQKWDGEPTEGYDVRGYVYVAPSFGGGISGTETRNGLSLGSDEQKKDFFKNRVYGKYNEKIFRMITDKLNESFIIRKETIEEWLINEHSHINSTLGVSDSGDIEVDDGPNFFLPNFEVFNKINVDRAVKIGYDVLQKIMIDVIEDYPIYPDGPVDAVSFYPAGVIGKTTATNQVDYFNNSAYDEWYKHATRVAGQAGYQLVQTELEKIHGKEDEDQSETDAINLKKHIDENINIPVKVGDTILTGRFKNKKVVVKNIGKDDHGMPTINGKKVVNFRLVKEGFIAEMEGSSVDCQRCDHSWEIEENDPHPYLCHNCGFDNQKLEYDYDEWNNWKEKEGLKNENRVKFYETHFRNLTPQDFKLLREGNTIKIEIPSKIKQNLNEGSSNGGYTADAGEPDAIFITNGKVRKLGVNKGRPEYWFENGGYTQLHYPKGDYPFGKGKGKDKESQQRTVKYKVKNVVKSTLPPPDPDNEGVDTIYETIKNESLFGGGGGMKPYEKLLMGGLVKFMQNKLGFSGKVVVKKKRSNSLFGDLSLSDAAMKGKFTLHYNPDATYEMMLRYLIHELIHAKQVAKGELKPSSDYKSLLWKGKPVISVKDYNSFQRKDIDQYKKLPWEKEAYGGMDKYYRMFLNSKEFKELVGKDPNLDYILSNLNEVGIGTGQSGLRMGYPDKDQLKKRMKDVENQRKQTDSNKEFQYEPINEGQLEDLGITDFKSLFKKMPSDLQKRVYNLKNVGQRKDTHPEGNVLKHTITVVNRSLKDDDIDIAIAAMFHDIGKDETIGIHPKKGHITHFGHEKVSANLVSKYKNWIQSVGGNPANVLYIVKNHMRYKQLSNMRPGKQTKLKSFRAFDKLGKFSKHDRGGLGEGMIMEGGAYGHMAHPFDTDINLTFGDLKDIANRALDGTLELTTEKTDGQALAISWRDDRGLIAARNKGHLKNRGESALDINGVSAKFQGRGGLSDAYNFAMKDLTSAIKSLSQKQREKIFQNGGSFMNLEVIYPTSVNVIPYGQPLLIFHGTMQYDENGNAIGENKEAARILAGMIKQVNQDVQDSYTIQGPPVVQLPKSQTLSSKKGKYLGQIQKLQSEFGLKDTDGVAEYHQAWWSNWVDKNSPVTLDNKTKMGLVKRWAFGDKSFRLDNKNIPDEKVLDWAKKHEKDNHKKISKDNLMKFENIFLGLGAEVLEFTSSALTVNPDKAIRDMKKRLDQTAKDVRKSGDPKKIAKLKLELERLNAIGGPSKIVPIEGIVFQYKGKTMKLTGSFASLNQILGIFYG